MSKFKFTKKGYPDSSVTIGFVKDMSAAIEILKSTGNDPTDYDIEEVKPCPYCHANKQWTEMFYKARPDVKKDGMIFGELIGIHSNCIGFDGQKYFFCSFGNVYGCPIEYCPMCGRPLNEDEE